jgi:hypothetical protein
MVLVASTGNGNGAGPTALQNLDLEKESFKVGSLIMHDHVDGLLPRLQQLQAHIHHGV